MSTPVVTDKWAGNLDCDFCRRKRLMGEEFSNKVRQPKMDDRGFSRKDYIIDLTSLYRVSYISYRRLWKNIENKAVRSNANSASN
jgi:hypothetical protein